MKKATLNEQIGQTLRSTVALVSHFGSTKYNKRT